MRRREIERRIVALHAFSRCPNAHGLKRKLGVPHLDRHGVLRRVARVGRAGDKRRNAEVARADGDLERADLVDDVSVKANCVRRAREHIHALTLHDKGRHVVGDDCHVKAHVMADRRGQARTLKIRSRLRAEQAHFFSCEPGFLEHHTDDGFPEALRHDRPLLREHRDQIFCDFVDLGIPRIVRPDDMCPDGLIHARAAFQRLLRRRQAAGTDLLHAFSRRRAGICDAASRLLEKGQLFFLRLLPAFPRSERHAHSGRGIRPRALGHHVADGLHDLHVRPARHKLYPSRIHAPV